MTTETPPPAPQPTLTREYFSYRGHFWSAPPGTLAKINETISKENLLPDPADYGAKSIRRQVDANVFMGCIDTGKVAA